MSIDMQALVATARRDGWATTPADLNVFILATHSLGWREVRFRTGDPAVSTLRPMTPDEAQPNSLSSRYGLDAQPLHTDGAQLATPPDIVALYSATPNATPTKLWTVATSLQTRFTKPDQTVPWLAIHNGIFLVSSGRTSFYATAGDRYQHRLRFDPGCMTPCDQRARIVADFFQTVLEQAHSYEWTAAGQLLLIDNTRTLHARAAVSPGDETRELQRIVYYTESRS